MAEGRAAFAAGELQDADAKFTAAIADSTPRHQCSPMPLLGQFVILSATYLAIDGLFLCSYGQFAQWVGRKLVPSARHHLDRLSGSFLIVAAVLLGLKDLEAR